MKAILVVDMPECCYDCDFCRFNGGYVHGYYGRDCLITGEDVQNNNFDIVKSRHETCPLKPMPNEREEKERVDFYDMGWNDCVRVLNNDYNLCKLG